MEIGRFFAASIYIAHCLIISVKTTKNRLNRHFIKQVPCLKKGVLRMALKKIM